MPDFAALKERVRIDQAAHMLELKMTGQAPQLRSPCPACNRGGDRGLSINTEKDSYYCFAARKGGDVIAFVAHVENIRQFDAAKLLDQHFPAPAPVQRQRSRPAEKPSEPGRGEFSALEYLVFEHEATQALGLPPATAKALGIGFAGRGVMRGCVVIPVYVAGKLSGYVGLDLVNGQVRLPKEWHHLPEDPKPEEPEEQTTVVPFKRPA